MLVGPCNFSQGIGQRLQTVFGRSYLRMLPYFQGFTVKCKVAQMNELFGADTSSFRPANRVRVSSCDNLMLLCSDSMFGCCRQDSFQRFTGINLTVEDPLGSHVSIRRLVDLPQREQSYFWFFSDRSCFCGGVSFRSCIF